MTDQQPIEPYEPPPGNSDAAAVRKLAKKRLQARKDFRQHLTAYWIVMTALVMIWFITGGIGSYFWPVWPMLGWGIGLAFHALSLRDTGITEEQISKEAAKLEARRLENRQSHREMPRLDGPQDEV